MVVYSKAIRGDAAAKPPHETRTTTRGGRKRLATEKQRFFEIGCAVDEQFPKFQSAFRLLRTLKVTNRNLDPNELRTELIKYQLTYNQITALLNARTSMGAAKRFIAQSLTSRNHPNGLSLQTINSCYSRYLKAVKT
jgi:hypothetical protein